MRITIVMGPWLPVPALQGGSVPRMWQGLAEQFALKGHEVNFICRAYPGQPAREVINGVKFYRRGGFTQSTNIKVDLGKDLIYASQLLTLLPPADILLINDFWLPILAGYLRKGAGRIVLNVNRFPKGQFFLYQRVARFIAASTVIRNAILAEKPALADITKVIANSVDHTVFYPAENRGEHSEKKILYLSRIHPEKGIHILIDAFALICQQQLPAKLVIVGPYKESQGGGGERYLQSLKEKAGNLPVEFHEPIFDQQKIADFYRSTDIFCLPTVAEKGEALPVAVIEAMSCGVVPVVSSLECFRDLIDEDVEGCFFDHRNTQAPTKLAEKLAYILSGSSRRLAMRRSAIERSTKFSSEYIANLFLADFAELLK